MKKGEQYIASNDMMRSGLVERYHTHPTPMKQNVAAHSWGVATIIAQLHPKPSSDLLIAALTHDAAEVFTGDSPYPAKRSIDGLRNMLQKAEDRYMLDSGIKNPDLTADETCWLKAADMTEALLWAHYQVKELGVVGYLRVINEALKALGKYRKEGILPEELSVVVEQIAKEYKYD